MFLMIMLKILTARFTPPASFKVKPTLIAFFDMELYECTISNIARLTSELVTYFVKHAADVIVQNSSSHINLVTKQR